MLQFPVIQKEGGDPSVVVVPAPAGVILGQILGSQNKAVESQLAQGEDAPASVPVQELVRDSVFETLDEDSAPVPVQESAKAGPGPVEAPYAGAVPVEAPYAAPVPVEAPYAGAVPLEAPYAAPVPVKAPYAGPIPVEARYAGPVPVESRYAGPVPVEAPYAGAVQVQASYVVPIPAQAPSDVPVQLQAPDDVPVQFPDAIEAPAPSQDAVPAAAPSAPSASPLVEMLYTKSPGRENPDQVLIEDLGPDDEDDICVPQNNGEDEDEGLDETPQMNTAEQNKMYAAPPLPSHPLPQQYLPGNPL